MYRSARSAFISVDFVMRSHFVMADCVITMPSDLQMKEKAAEETISHATFQVRQSMRTLGSGLKARSLLIASRQENVRACDKVLHA